MLKKLKILLNRNVRQTSFSNKWYDRMTQC